MLFGNYIISCIAEDGGGGAGHVHSIPLRDDRQTDRQTGGEYTNFMFVNFVIYGIHNHCKCGWWCSCTLDNDIRVMLLLLLLMTIRDVIGQ